MTATHTTDSPLISAPRVSHDPAALQRDLKAHMLFNFTDMSRYETDEMPVFVRGEGCYVEDVHGRRFIDGLSGLFCTNLGQFMGGNAAASWAIPQLRQGPGGCHGLYDR